jgi:hypothetical protein
MVKTDNYWTVQKLWPDSTVFIVGGGKSLNRTGLQWNETNKGEILQAISNDLSCIHDKRVIGVNDSFKLGDWIDICFYGDTRWFDWNVDAITKFSGLVICCHPQNKVDWIKTVDRENGFGINRNPKLVNWNKSSGGAAINLAVHLGAKNIVLIGFDMFMEADGEDNWHKEHKILNKVKSSPYERMRKAFAEIKHDTDSIGIRIINTSLTSRIEDFEKMPLEEAVGECCND